MRLISAALALALSAGAAHAASYGLPATCALLESGGSPSDVIDLGDEHFYLDEHTLMFTGAVCLVLPRTGENVVLACNHRDHGKTEESATITRGSDMATISFPDGTGINLLRC